MHYNKIEQAHQHLYVPGFPASVGAHWATAKVALEIIRRLSKSLFESRHVADREEKGDPSRNSTSEEQERDWKTLQSTVALAYNSQH